MKRKENERGFQNLKKKLMSALAMLLIATILMTTTSYAWLVMSVAPEVSGITTNIGANGSLEIVLLNTDTWQDLSSIRSGMDNSLATRSPSANNNWGNLVDLSFRSYGLSEIILMPARLNAVARGDGYVVNSGILSVPSYGYDGRVIDLTEDVVSTTYKEDGFSYILGTQDYGVRALGTTNSLTVQGAALAQAKTNIATYTNSANSNVSSVLKGNGDALFGIVLAHATDASGTYDDDDLAIIKGLINGLQDSLNYIDLALRQGIIAVAASVIGSEDTFVAVRDLVADSSRPLSTIMGQLEAVGELPGNYGAWITSLENTQNNLNLSKNACEAMTGGVYTWQQLRGALDNLMNIDLVYINDTSFGDLDMGSIGGLLGGDVALTLAPGSGLFADIADFTGNVSTFLSIMGTSIEMRTLSAVNPSYLAQLSAAVKDLEAADGSAAGETKVELTSIYGYALDLAFRCNAPLSSLLLQTTPEQRIYDNSTAPSTMGGGSYMEFTSMDESFNAEQQIKLMDAVRVAFLDDQGNILGVAKLNTSNRTTENGAIKAPLYLYDFTISTGEPIVDDTTEPEVDTTEPEVDATEPEVDATEPEADATEPEVDATEPEVDATEPETDPTEPELGEDPVITYDKGAMVMGERRLTDNVIADLDQNVAKAITVVVWLDGDIVDNTYVSSSGKTSLNGTLNLQFASSANLVPADNDVLMNVTPDKSDLTALVEEYAATYEGGQRMYVTSTWKKFATAYEYASAVVANFNSNDAQVYNANLNLTEAYNELVLADKSALGDKIAEMREFMGQTTDLARYVLRDASGNYYSVDPFTEEQRDQKVGEIYRVDYNKNLRDEGSDVFTPIYTDASWSCLAAALYDAEVVHNWGGNDGYVEMDAAITALDKAYDELRHAVLFEPYEFDGRIYYFAISDVEDTYGKWYDWNFKRIVSDLKILELDAGAKKADVAVIHQDSIPYTAEMSMTPYVELLKDLYPDLNRDEIIAIQWSVSEKLIHTVDASQIAYLKNLIARAESCNKNADNPAAIDTSAAVSMRDKIDQDQTVTAAEAEEVISALEAKVVASEKVIAEKLADKEAAAVDKTTAIMTSDNRIVLTAAVSSAKTYAKYEDAEAGAALKAATQAAEALLARDDDNDPETPYVTIKEAEDALDALNKELKAVGMKEVTAYNTIQHKIPVGSEIIKVAYSVDTNSTMIRPNKDTGTAEIKAIILTRNGMIYTVTKTVTIYAPALGVNLVPSGSISGGTITNGTDVSGETVRVWDGKIKEGASGTISAALIHPKAAEDGTKVDLSVGETIKKCTWASTDTKILTVTGSGTSGCSIKAVASGTAKITVTVETEEGNSYYEEIWVTVTAP